MTALNIEVLTPLPKGKHKKARLIGGLLHFSFALEIRQKK
jgi:hypothetical protein